MATQPITGSVSAFPAISPMPAVARILARFERDQLAGFIAVALDLIDTLDGDDDLEQDDPSGQCDEDEINTSHSLAFVRGAGCALADPGGCEDDGREPDDGN